MSLFISTNLNPSSNTDINISQLIQIAEYSSCKATNTPDLRKGEGGGEKSGNSKLTVGTPSGVVDIV